MRTISGLKPCAQVFAGVDGMVAADVEFGDVGARAEASARAGQDDRAHACVALGGAQRVGQRLEHGA